MPACSQLFHACRNLARELLLEVLPTSRCDPARFEIAAVMRHLYEHWNLFPIGGKSNVRRVTPNGTISAKSSRIMIRSAAESSC